MFVMSAAEARAAWIDGLENGEYPQGTDRLCSPAGYCCLGVACELFRKHEGESSLPKDDRGDYCIYGSRDDRSADALPFVVKRWLGLFNNIGSFDGGSLLKLNDDGTSFQEIAKVIASEPKGLLNESVRT